VKEKTDDTLPMKKMKTLRTKKMKTLRTIIYKLRKFFETPTHLRTHKMKTPPGIGLWALAGTQL
jgi:hypothetical protein